MIAADTQVKKEMYQQQNGRWLWLAERSSSGKMWEWTLGRKEEKEELRRDATMWRRPKIMAPIFGKLCKRIPLPPRSCGDRTSEKTRVKRTTTENEKDNNKVCVCSLSLSFSPHDVLFLSFLIFCFSLFDDY